MLAICYYNTYYDLKLLWQILKCLSLEKYPAAIYFIVLGSSLYSVFVSPV